MGLRRQTVRWILAGLVALVAAGTWIGLLILRAHRTLQEHRREVRAYRETISPAASDRSPIFDPPEPGNAWELERQALQRINDDLLQTDDVPSRSRMDTLNGPVFVLDEPEEMTRQLQQAEPHFELLRAALRRRHVVPDHRPGWVTDRWTGEVLELLRHSAGLHHDRQEDFAAFERLVLSIALAQDVARHGDDQHRSTLWRAETQAAARARRILEAHALSVQELEIIARWLDRLASARPPLALTIFADDAVERSMLVDPEFVTAVFISAVDPTVEPTWRELWSPTLHAAKRASALAQAARRFARIDALPPWDRMDEARRVSESLDLKLCGAWAIPDQEFFQWEVRGLTVLAHLRLGIALAWYEREHEAFPAALGSLVPRYLPAVPLCPRTGRSIHYEQGRFWIDLAPDLVGVEGDDTASFGKAMDAGTASWKIGRRPK
jgi:hypothetical protein